MARAQAPLVVVAAVMIIATAATVLVGTASGAIYTVGEPGGSWDPQTNLTSWSSTVDFHPGDQLVFKYDASAHDVVEVTEAGYTSCSAASAVAGGTGHQSGSDAFKLRYVGRRYFICGNPRHCGAGMKLEVSVTPLCTNSSGTICYNVPVGMAPPGWSSASLGSLLVAVVSSLLLGLTIAIA